MGDGSSRELLRANPQRESRLMALGLVQDFDAATGRTYIERDALVTAGRTHGISAKSSRLTRQAGNRSLGSFTLGKTASFF